MKLVLRAGVRSNKKTEKAKQSKTRRNKIEEKIRTARTPSNSKDCLNVDNSHRCKFPIQYFSTVPIFVIHLRIILFIHYVQISIVVWVLRICFCVHCSVLLANIICFLVIILYFYIRQHIHRLKTRLGHTFINSKNWGNWNYSHLNAVEKREKKFYIGNLCKSIHMIHMWNGIKWSKKKNEKKTTIERPHKLSAHVLESKKFSWLQQVVWIENRSRSANITY